MYTFGFTVAKLPPQSAASSANTGIFLLGSGWPKPQSTQAPGPLAEGVGQGCVLHTQAAQDLEWGPLGAQKSRSRKLRLADALFRSLISDPRAAAHPKANSNEPVTLPEAPTPPLRPPPCLPGPAPEGCSSCRVKTGKTGSLAWSLQLPFSSASNEASSGIMQKGTEGGRSQGTGYATASLAAQSTVLGQWGEAQRWKGLPQMGAGCLGSL